MEVRNGANRLVCTIEIEDKEKVISILLKGYLTEIHFPEDGSIAVLNFDLDKKFIRTRLN